MTQRKILTVGHSNHSIRGFINLLVQFDVSVVADVRSSPFSGHNPQFNRQELKDSLRECEIGYVFLGKELGARSENPADYEGNRVSYARLASRESFRSGISRVLNGSQEHNVALMCAEREPLDCHRTILVAQALFEQGVGIGHILADGALESHGCTLKRLVKMVVSPIDDLFGHNCDPVADALLAREQQIAYVKREMVV